MTIEHININDTIEPIPAVHAAQIDDRIPLDLGQIDKATLKQLRKNIERLKSMQQVDTMKKVSHFDIRAFFPVGKK